MNLTILRFAVLALCVGAGPFATDHAIAKGFLVAKSVSADGQHADGPSGGWTQQDFAAIRTQVPTLDMLVPVRVSRLSASSVNGTAEVTVVKTTAELPFMTPRMVNVRIERGHFLTHGDLQSRSKVVVLGSAVARELFPSQNCIGKNIRLGGVPCQVIGVMSPADDTDVSDSDMQVFVPFTTLLSEDRSQHTRIDAIWMSVDPSHLDATRQVVEEILKKRYPVQAVSVEIAAVPRPPTTMREQTKWILVVVLGALCFLGFLVIVTGVTIGLIVWRVASKRGSTASTESQ